MTIIKNILAIRHHPFNAIDAAVVEVILEGQEMVRSTVKNPKKSYTISLDLTLLEGYCDLTDQRITMETLRSPAIETIMQGFAKAVAGKELIDLSIKAGRKPCRKIYYALNAARKKYPDFYPVEWDFTQYHPDPAICHAIATASDDKRWYWEGWYLKGKLDGRDNVYPRLAQLVIPYGHEFIRSVDAELQNHYLDRANSFSVEWNHMFDYLSKHHSSWPLHKFQNESGVRSFMAVFTHAYFTAAKKAAKDGKAQIKNWGKFLNSVEECLCKTNIWSTLTAPIKRPPPLKKHPSETKTKQHDNGMIVQEKLLTDIPLHVTDAEAVEILFFHIKRDVATVRGWATAQYEDLKARYTRRISLAQEDQPILQPHANYAYKNYSLADICTTLEDTASTVRQEYLCKIYNYQTGENFGAIELAHTFGFPTAHSLLPLQCLLVLEHPEITTEFLKSFELYNAHGQLTGFDKENRLLIGYKDRKQPEVREQIIELSDYTYTIVMDIIDFTALPRRGLRADNDDAWRYLFLTTGRAFKPYKIAGIPGWNESEFEGVSGLRERLIKDFSPHSDLPEGELVEFIKRIRLKSIRASRAVEVFLQTKSTDKMSKALGHERYYPDLLSHYLPDALLAFIKARWIRVFQKALVCEAMKDSPYLFRVTQFATMDELDTFLENHRIKEIPSQAADPERKAQVEQVEKSEAILSIGVPFLASLLSLEAAVSASLDRARVCGKAEYWASLADKIKTEILGGRRAELKKYLEAAMKLVDPRKMEALIYVPAHWS